MNRDIISRNKQKIKIFISCHQYKSFSFQANSKLSYNLLIK